MSKKLLSLSINSGTGGEFEGLGNPAVPAKKMKFPGTKQYDSDYAGYAQSCSSTFGRDGKELDSISQLSTGGLIRASADKLSLSIPFEYEDEGDSSIKNTYKLFGMDVNADFEAVIKVGNGYAIVGSLFDKGKLESFCNEEIEKAKAALNSGWGGDGAAKLLNLHQEVKDIIDSLTLDQVRKFATSLKTGALYSMGKAKEGDLQYADFFTKYKTDLAQDFEIVAGNAVGNTPVPYSSVLLNIASRNAKEAKAAATTSQVSVSSDIRLQAILRAFGKVWAELMGTYQVVKNTLSSIDLWSYFAKKSMGERAFNDKLAQAIVVSDADTGEAENTVISFAGISKNTVVGAGDSDIDTIESAMSSVSDLHKAFGEQVDERVLDSIDFSALIGSCANSEDLQATRGSMSIGTISGYNVYYPGQSSTSLEELQALSVMDSLSYIDEDASVCRSSYDMSDPEQRGIYVKSAIRSYERNFKEFKPVSNYEVTEAMAELVERADPQYEARVSLDMVSAASTPYFGNSDVTTDTVADIAEVDKKSFLKVLKLSKKMFSRINDCLGGVATATP